MPAGASGVELSTKFSVPGGSTAFKLRTTGLDGNVVLKNVVFNKCSGMTATHGVCLLSECNLLRFVSSVHDPTIFCLHTASVAYELVYNGACVKGSWLSTVHGQPSVQACSVKAREFKSSKPVTYFTYAANNGECAFYAGKCTGGDKRKRFSTYKLNIGTEEGKRVSFEPTISIYSLQCIAACEHLFVCLLCMHRSGIQARARVHPCAFNQDRRAHGRAFVRPD